MPTELLSTKVLYGLVHGKKSDEEDRLITKNELQHVLVNTN